MALTNDAKIKDIITELQNMQMINGKSEVVNVLGSPFVATDNPAQIVDKIQVLKNNMASNLNAKGVNAVGSEDLSRLVSKIGNISLGKKWASGNIIHPAKLGEYNINNLTFSPSIVLMELDCTSTSMYSLSGVATLFSRFKNIYVGSSSEVTERFTITPMTNGFKYQASWYSSDGYQIVNRPITWIAIE